jgi:hypothetical protein
MKALKTIVATAVIVFALTTVAMAGVRQVSSRGDSAAHSAGPAAPQTHQDSGVTLTDDQFARLLQAVNGQSAKLHTTQADPDMSRVRAGDRDHSRQKARDSVIHVKAQQRTRTHDGGSTHAHGTKGGKTHGGGTHPGGDTHYDGGTHDYAGTHDGGSHDGGTHDGGTHHE